MAIRAGDPARRRAARLDTQGQWLVGTARRRPGEREVSHTGDEVSSTGEERGRTDRGSIRTAQPVGEQSHIFEDRSKMRPTQSKGETAQAGRMAALASGEGRGGRIQPGRACPARRDGARKMSPEPAPAPPAMSPKDTRDSAQYRASNQDAHECSRNAPNELIPGYIPLNVS